MHKRGIYILNYFLSVLFLLAFSLKDLHPVLAHHHSVKDQPVEITDIKPFVHNDIVEQECFICDLFFSVKAINNNTLPAVVLTEIIVDQYLPVSDSYTNLLYRKLSARAPPYVIAS